MTLLDVEAAVLAAGVRRMWIPDVDRLLRRAVARHPEIEFRGVRVTPGWPASGSILVALTDGTRDLRICRNGDGFKWQLNRRRERAEAVAS